MYHMKDILSLHAPISLQKCLLSQSLYYEIKMWDVQTFYILMIDATSFITFTKTDTNKKLRIVNITNVDLHNVFSNYSYPPKTILKFM